jgi:hypothetical protein
MLSGGRYPEINSAATTKKLSEYRSAKDSLAEVGEISKGRGVSTADQVYISTKTAPRLRI